MRIIALLLSLVIISPLSATGFLPTLRCEPLLPVFCSNIHVGCAGRTDIETTGFLIEFSPNGAAVKFDDSEQWTSSVASANGDLIFRHIGLSDWIRLEPDGRFSHRIYLKDKALMTYGTCKQRAVG